MEKEDFDKSERLFEITVLCGSLEKWNNGIIKINFGKRSIPMDEKNVINHLEVLAHVMPSE